MRLNDPLTTSFSFLEKNYAINLAFDIVLDVFDVLQDDELLFEDKIEVSMQLLLGDNELDLIQKIEMFTFIYQEYLLLGQKEEIVTDELGNVLPTKPFLRDMDIALDAKYIYASFRQIGINLFEEQGRLSWEEFQALLETLPDETPIQRIRSIRNWEPQKGDSPEHKRQMRELQKRYALPNYIGEEEEDE
jgi:hypothetical protein